MSKEEKAIEKLEIIESKYTGTQPVCKTPEAFAWKGQVDEIYQIAMQALTLLRQQPVCETCGGSGKVKYLTSKYDADGKDLNITCLGCKGTGIEPKCQQPDSIGEAGKFVKETQTKIQQWKEDYRMIFKYDIELVPINELLKACDIIVSQARHIGLLEECDDTSTEVIDKINKELKSQAEEIKGLKSERTELRGHLVSIQWKVDQALKKGKWDE